jgi:hypothetical protein
MVEGRIVNKWFYDEYIPKYPQDTAGEIRIPEERLPPYPPKIYKGVERPEGASHG